MEDKKRIRTDASRKADKTYKEKHDVKNISISFKTENDKLLYDRLIAYVEILGTTKNAYIKELIKKDMDSKKVPYPEQEK